MVEAQSYIIMCCKFYKRGRDQVLRLCIDKAKQISILHEAHYNILWSLVAYPLSWCWSVSKTPQGMPMIQVSHCNLWDATKANYEHKSFFQMAQICRWRPWFPVTASLVTLILALLQCMGAAYSHVCEWLCGHTHNWKGFLIYSFDMEHPLCWSSCVGGLLPST